LPSSPTEVPLDARRLRDMGPIIVGVDPHKRSVTIEVIDGEGKVLATGRFGTLNRDYHGMLSYVRQQWPHHRWAVEGAQGVGRPWRNDC
jgi:transposase